MHSQPTSVTTTWTGMATRTGTSKAGLRRPLSPTPIARRCSRATGTIQVMRAATSVDSRSSDIPTRSGSTRSCPWCTRTTSRAPRNSGSFRVTHHLRPAWRLISCHPTRRSPRDPQARLLRGRRNSDSRHRRPDQRSSADLTQVGGKEARPHAATPLCRMAITCSRLGHQTPPGTQIQRHLIMAGPSTPLAHGSRSLSGWSESLAGDSLGCASAVRAPEASGPCRGKLDDQDREKAQAR